MQTAITPTPVAPGTPATPQAVSVEIPGLPTRPITDAEIQVIRRQRSEMSNQLSSARERREEVLDELRAAPAGAEEGLRQHLAVLNSRITAIESDLEKSGSTLRSGQVPVGTVMIPPRSFDGAEAAARGASISAMVLLPIMIGFFILRFRRRGRRAAPQANSAEHDARMERLEQAVDAIALEIERVGESQRFTQKVLAEANIMPALNAGQRSAEPIRAREYEELRDR
jgi:hypothetical protein